MKAISMSSAGGPNVVELVDRPEPVPGPGQALVEVFAAGVNFMDTGVRRGVIWAEMPFPRVLGVEGSGRVLAVGEGVHHVRPGERVAWVYAPGSYAERLSIPADALVPVPDAIDDQTAAGVMMQGLTASHFATDFYPVQPGDWALVHHGGWRRRAASHPDHQIEKGACDRPRVASRQGGRGEEAGADHVDRGWRRAVRRAGHTSVRRRRRRCRL